MAQIDNFVKKLSRNRGEIHAVGSRSDFTASARVEGGNRGDKINKDNTDKIHGLHDGCDQKTPNGYLTKQVSQKLDTIRLSMYFKES